MIPHFSFAQSISGIVNSYYKVTEVHTDYIQLEVGSDLSSLQPGDKVVLIQMAGVNVPDIPGFETENLSISNLGNAGHYEMLAVSGVNDATDRVTVTVTLDDSKYTTGEKIQLVKIYEADYTTVSGTLTVPSWDGDTGGVMALVIFKKLTLNANIDVSSKGFRGANPEPDYTMGCRPAYVPDTFYFQSSVNVKAGRKGEGNIKAIFNYPIGPGRVVTGGGGGLGWFAGGGGGSHYGAGGIGGRQKQGCAEGLYASGGISLTSYNFYGFDRVTLGGGGGSSTEDVTYSATKGGNGGGIVILLVDTLVGNGGNIVSNGEAVAGTVSAGGSGGGAGGAVLLDANVFSGSIIINARGGKGGDTGGTPYTGAGGGGGGGVVWQAGSVLPTGMTFSAAGGNRGESPSSSYRGVAGSAGTRLTGLQLPLNGFLFNSLVAPDTICAGMEPEVITGSMPKGGSSGYTYTWLQSTDSVNWSNAVDRGGSDSLHFYPAELVQTTYFTRVVESGVVIDTARAIKIFVHDSIEGNLLTLRDTLCYKMSPGILSGGVLSGGNGSYSYQWESSINQTSWDPRSTNPSFNEGNLQQSTYYRRIAKSARVCIDTSNIDTLSVIPLITNNTFLRADTAICSGLDAGAVKMLYPGGGDGTYQLQWWNSTDDISYSPIGGATGQNYAPGTLITDRYYKRVVHSGADAACKDTSVSFYIEVYPLISNNQIQTDSIRYCAGNIPLPFTGLLPTGGDDPDYSYSWQQRELLGSWSDIAGEATINYAPSTQFEDTVQIRRVVESGLNSTCVDNSNIIQLDVIPYIINDLVTTDSAICEGATPLPFTEAVASGGAGAGSYGYLWESQLVSGGSWQPAPGINDQPSYTSGELTLSTQFRRAVTSQICSDNSDPVTITVYPYIINNSITGSAIQYTCFNTGKELNGNPALDGGKPGDKRFIWEDSDEGVNWDQADGVFNQVDYTSPALSDTLFFRRIVLSGEHDQCMDTTDAVLVRINDLPSGDILSGIDTACAGNSITVQYTGLLGPSPWTLILGENNPGTSFIVTSPSGEINFPTYESGLIRVLDLMDDSTCHADLSSSTGVIDLTVYEVPVAYAGADTQICGPIYNLNALPSVGTGTWSGNGVTFVDEHNPHTEVEIQTYGSYIFTWTEENWRCPDADDIEVIFYQQPEIPFAGEDQSLDYIFYTNLDADPPAFGEGYWQFVTGTGMFEDSTLYNTFVEFPELGTYELRWTIMNGVCEPVSNIVTVILNDLQVFRGFSPNDDGINEVFLLKLSGREKVELIILDRWGNQIYSGFGVDEISWDGTIDGENPVPEGTYFYIIKDPSRKDDEVGSLELRR